MAKNYLVFFLLTFLLSTAHAAESPLTLAPEAIAAGHIELAQLVASRVTTTVTAFGQILDPAQLTALSAQLTEAKAQIAAAEAKLSLANANADRASKLFHAQHNISVAEFQSAESATQVAAADADVAKARLHSLEARIRADWGAGLASSITSDTDPLPALQAGTACLVQAILPLGQALPVPPETASASIPDNGTLPLKLIGLSPRVPTGMSGQALFYVSSQPACPPIGMPLQVALPDGPEQQGVVIPASAVIWQGAQPIVYQASSQNSFLPIPISTADKQTAGYFVAVGPDEPLKPGASVVVKGAALLLSQSQSPAEKTSAPSGDDDD